MKIEDRLISEKKRLANKKETMMKIRELSESATLKMKPSISESSSQLGLKRRSTLRALKGIDPNTSLKDELFM